VQWAHGAVGIFLILAWPLAHASSCETFSCYQNESLRCAISSDADDLPCRGSAERAIGAARTADEQLEAAFAGVTRKMHLFSDHLRGTSSDKAYIANWQAVDAAPQLCMKQWSSEHYLQWRRAYSEAARYSRPKSLPLPGDIAAQRVSFGLPPLPPFP
jgi:hypothetical protein